MDYRERNLHIDVYKAVTDVGTSKLRVETTRVKHSTTAPQIYLPTCAH